MDSSKLSIKFFLQNPQALRHEALVPVFHSWIQTRAIPDHLLIDVADYQHVWGGPGTVLVALEANYYVDRQDNRPGLLYSRKQPLLGSFRDRLCFAWRSALHACSLLENDPRLGQLKFRTDESVFKIHDRLLAPNTPETFDNVRPELSSFLNELYNSNVQLEHSVGPQELFDVRICASESPDVKSLLSRLGAATPTVPAPAQ